MSGCSITAVVFTRYIHVYTCTYTCIQVCVGCCLATLGAKGLLWPRVGQWSWVG